MELLSLEIDAVIVHEVPARMVRGGSPPPRLSDIESPLDDELRTFIADRMRDTLHTKGIDVRFADGTSSPVPGLLSRLLLLPDSTSDEDLVEQFVDAPRTVAEHLYASQTGQNSTGLLTFIRGKIDDQRCFGILKLQKEEGARFQLQEIEGHQTFTLERMKQLMLTDSTRVFKASLFRLVQADSVQGVDPALMYATNKTGLIVTEMNQHLLSDEDLAEWKDAIEEYYELEGHLGAGED